MSKEEINQFITSSNNKDLLSIVMNQETKAEILVELAKIKDKNIQYWIPWNVNTPTDILLEWASNEQTDENILYGLATCSTARPAVLAKLVSNPSQYIRYWVACNDNTPAEVLIKLAEDKTEFIRDAVSIHPNTPEPVKLWLNNNGFAGLTLAEFMGGIHESSS